MLRILGRGHSVPTVTELIFCESAVLFREVQDAFIAQWLSTAIQLFQLLFREVQDAFIAQWLSTAMQLLFREVQDAFIAQWLSTALSQDSNWIQLLSAKRKLLLWQSW